MVPSWIASYLRILLSCDVRHQPGDLYRRLRVELMAYTAFDRLVAWLRFRAALPHIRPRTRVCDIGCGHGARFLRNLGSHIKFGVGVDRSEEHTSELQSRGHLVCRLLLEKKKYKPHNTTHPDSC